MVGGNNPVMTRHKCTGERGKKSSKNFVDGLAFLPNSYDTDTTSKQDERETMNTETKKIQVQVQQLDALMGYEVTRGGSFDDLESLFEAIRRVGIENILSIEITSNK